MGRERILAAQTKFFTGNERARAGAAVLFRSVVAFVWGQKSNQCSTVRAPQPSINPERLSSEGRWQ